MLKLPQNTYTKKILKAIVLLAVLIAYYCCLPDPLFKDPTCMVLNDKEGQLLGARIAADGQWRFPYQETIPDKFIKAITTFEDQRFFQHPGIDIIGIGRAIKQNLKAGKVVSGASTISMQVIRLARKGKERSFIEKIKELILATRLELAFSKKEILALYASHAPFGGNVVGLETASWRYFGKQPALLSWAEAAMLAVLPNSPALIHPGRNRTALLEKRNRLLQRLFELKYIDEVQLSLSKEESLPLKPLPLPNLAPHLLDRVQQEVFTNSTNTLTRLTTTVDVELQTLATQIIQKHQHQLKGNDIHNSAALLLEVESGQVLAYVGNAINTGKAHGEQVDIIKAPRSTGSILKPFLYAGLLQEGQVLPNSLVTDIPIQMNGYQPKNFHESYDGVVPASQALIRSLNVPFIKLLQLYGLEKFHFLLHQLGLSTIRQPAHYYGLPLILGGAEGTLWDITNAYRAMAKTLNNFSTLNGAYDPTAFLPASYTDSAKPRQALLSEAPVLNAASIYYTFEAMKNVERPNAAGNWEQFSSSQNIAWKTGTSIGFRDAWAVGVTAKYAVGVWVGNADGEGRPGLVGVQTAAPILFDLFDLLPTADWFDLPYDECVALAVCKKSGYRASTICPTDTTWAPISGQQVPLCTYHQLIHLDPTGRNQVNSTCMSPTEMKHEPWFILPPGEAHYYQFVSPSYQALPPYLEGCVNKHNSSSIPMEMIYPKQSTKITIPRDIDGSMSQTVFKAAHRDPLAIIYWHLDNAYIGSTQSFHHQALNPLPGKHVLTLIDEQGNRLEQNFEIAP